MSTGAAVPEIVPSLEGKDWRTRRRRFVNKLMIGLCALAAMLAVAMLAIIVVTVFVHGFKALSIDFFTKPTPQPAVGQSEGAGVANAIIGSLIIVAIATLIAVPIGVLVAIFTNEFAGRRLSQFVRLTLDVLNGVPSVVIGIFIFGLLVVGRGQAAWIAGVALAIIQIPLIARSTQEVLSLVPSALREGSAALGTRNWQTVVKIVVPSSLGGIITGTLLAVARVAGETAPIIFASSLAANVISWDPSQALFTLPFSIFIYSESPDPHDHELAWAAALVLMLFVLVLSFLGRVFLARNRRKLEGNVGSGSIALGRYFGRAIEPMRRSRSDDTDAV
jgi:phosphate transport system permease protein